MNTGISLPDIFIPESNKINGKPVVDGAVIEAGLESCNLIQKVSKLLEGRTGSWLIMDYGHNYINNQSLRAINNHKFVDLFHKPGESDISADVDFGSFKRLLDILKLKSVRAYGPIPQGYFLCGMGIEQRANMLLENIKEGERQNLIDSIHRIVDEDKMGMIYKMFAITTHGLPTGFENGEIYWNRKDI